MVCSLETNVNVMAKNCNTLNIIFMRASYHGKIQNTLWSETIDNDWHGKFV